MAHRENIELISGKNFLLKDYPKEFSDEKQYAEYMLDLPATKELLTSDNLVYAVDSYSMRYYLYNKILHNILEQNKELIKIIQSISK